MSMLKAVKENKVYKIHEEDESWYNNHGYDIYDEDGKLIKYSAKKVILYSQHLEIVKNLETEIEALKAQIEDKKKSSGK